MFKADFENHRIQCRPDLQLKAHFIPLSELVVILQVAKNCTGHGLNQLFQSRSPE